MSTVTMNPKRIDDEVLAVLAEMDCDGDLVKMPNLDRALYVRVNKVLETLGGKWNRSRKGHVFKSGDAASSLEAAVQFGEYVDPKVVFQDFPTPPELASELVDLAMFDHAHTSPILEPSCGDGNLVRAMIEYGCSNIHAIDIRPECCAKLAKLPHVKTTCGDFMEIKAKPTYRAVVMNPPFCKGQDIAHVRHAFDFLLTGGILVAIMSPSFTFNGSRKATAFRCWAQEMGATWRENPPNSFKSSGTNVNTITFMLTKE